METLAAKSHYTVAAAAVAEPVHMTDTPDVVAASDDAVLNFEIAGHESDVVEGSA